MPTPGPSRRSWPIASGLKVEIKRGSGESGVLHIKYGNFDQLDYLRLRILGANGG